MKSSKITCLIGLIGAGIQNSLAPEIHMSEGEQHGLRYVYRLIDLAELNVGVDALPNLIDAAERTGFNGLAITHPCKQAALPYLMELSDDAEALGAVNTVVFRDGKRIGHNTDWVGFAQSLQIDMEGVALDRVVQLGAGGAGAAVAHAALTAGVRHLTVFDIDAERAASVVSRLSARFGSDRIKVGENVEAAVSAASGLINATPIGMDDHPGLPVAAGLLRPDLWVADVIYFPRETELLRRARALGARAMNGGGMVVFQAVEQFRLFTEIEPDVARMRRRFKELT